MAYKTPAEFAVDFAALAERILAAAPDIRTVDRETVKTCAFTMLRFAVLCTKHPGFHEEREWRVVATPTMHPSPLVKSEVEVVRGIPQVVLKIDLQDHPEQGLIGLTLPELLERIIIGPCEFPFVVLKGFRQLLAESAVPNPEQKVIVSDIPLRHLGA